MHTRRDFIRNMTAMAAAGLLPRFSLASPQELPLKYASKPLRGGSLVIGGLMDGGNVWLIPSEEGPILIDAKFAHTAKELAADVQMLVRSRPALLINTHHHADHTGGNWIFSEDARLVAHKNLAPRLKANLPQYVRQAENHAAELAQSGAAEEQVRAARDMVERVGSLTVGQFTPHRNLEDGRTGIDHGGVALHCHHFGNGHTDNDLVIHLPQHNIVHMGDLLFHNVHPFIDRGAKADTRKWQENLRHSLELCDEETIVIPGHGEVTNRAALTKQIEYFDRLREIVTQAIQDGRTREEVTAMRPEAFRDYGFDFIRPIAFGGMYDELMALRQN